jgi:hypothetical protein
MTASSNSDRRIRRTTAFGCLIGLIVAYGVLIPMRTLAGPSEPYFSLPLILIYPAIMFAWLGGIVVTGTLCRRHSFVWVTGLTAGLVAVVLAVGA